MGLLQGSERHWPRWLYAERRRAAAGAVARHGVPENEPRWLRAERDQSAVCALMRYRRSVGLVELDTVPSRMELHVFRAAYLESLAQQRKIADAVARGAYG